MTNRISLEYSSSKFPKRKPLCDFAFKKGMIVDPARLLPLTLKLNIEAQVAQGKADGSAEMGDLTFFWNVAHATKTHSELYDAIAH